MTTRLSLLALAAALALSACNNDDHTIVQQGPYDPMANELANAAPPPPLPSIVASKSYRCSGSNEVIEVDWTELDGKPASANLRVGVDTIASTVLSASAEGGDLFSGPDGTKVTGTKGGGSVSLTRPGKGTATCKA